MRQHYMPFVKTQFRRIAIGTIKVFLLLLFALFIASEWYELPIGARAVDRVYALFNPDTHSDDLPSDVGITINGFTAAFYKGTPAYNQLVSLLRRDRAVQLPIAELEVLFPRSQCGQIMVHSFGIPFHFRLLSTTARPNYYWLQTPNSTGMELMEFCDDGTLLKLIHAPSAQ